MKKKYIILNSYGCFDKNEKYLLKRGCTFGMSDCECMEEFFSYDEALKAFNEYQAEIWREHGIYCVREYTMEEIEVDDDGDETDNWEEIAVTDMVFEVWSENKLELLGIFDSYACADDFVDEYDREHDVDGDEYDWAYISACGASHL